MARFFVAPAALPPPFLRMTALSDRLLEPSDIKPWAARQCRGRFETGPYNSRHYGADSWVSHAYPGMLALTGRLLARCRGTKAPHSKRLARIFRSRAPDGEPVGARHAVPTLGADGRGGRGIPTGTGPWRRFASSQRPLSKDLCWECLAPTIFLWTEPGRADACVDPIHDWPDDPSRPLGRLSFFREGGRRPILARASASSSSACSSDTGCMSVNTCWMPSRRS